MTAADLISRIRREVQTDLPDGELLDMLNAEQLELAVDLKVPTQTIEVSGVTTDFTLPDGTQYNALLSAQNEYGHTIELMTVASANALFPGWSSTTWSGAGARPFALIYDPANISAPVRPLPNPSAVSTYRMTVALRPLDMVELSDEPFTALLTDGTRSVELRDSHDLLVWGVVAKLHLRNSDNRAGAYFGRYQELKDMAWRDTRPSPQRMRRHESHFRRRSWR